MSDEQEKHGKKEKISVSPEEFASAIKDAVQSQAQILAEAIIESRKPYTPPQVEENREIARQNTRKLEARKKTMERYNQDACPHLQGCLGEQPGNRTSIVWHRLDDGVTVFGICIACQKQFWPDDPPYTDGSTYMQWRRKACANSLSEAGMRYRSERIPRELDPATPAAEIVVHLTEQRKQS